MSILTRGFDRKLETVTLDNAAKHYAEEFSRGTVWSPRDKTLAIGGRDWVLQSLYNAFYKDEFEYLLPRIRDEFTKTRLADFDDETGRRFSERTDETFEQYLKTWLAVDPDGKHVKGARGLVEIGRRFIGIEYQEKETRESIRRRKLQGLPLHVPGRIDREVWMAPCRVFWPIFAGEGEERAAGNTDPVWIDGELRVLDRLPPGTPGLPLGATNPAISNEACLGALNFIVDSLDEGSTAATIRGRTGTQPTTVDDTESGTLLFTLTCSDPAFGAAGDQNPGGRATASAITNDSSADATNTLGYCRAGATGTGADDHIDGEAGTSASDFNFNTLSIVSGSTVSMSAWTVDLPET